ncbi:MAG TPA: ubiquinol-cytochrome c reductase iron-sulfur subunit [Bryobacteraceae bacterium]|nr:ubiquinol-cytochrome c reductase iron-sulfur subunit [Bryobacteraceae bacterium]
MNETRGSDRRYFCVTCIYSLWGLIGLALGLPAAVYLLVPPKPRKESEWVEAGDVSQLEPGVPNELVFRRNRVDGWKITSEKTSAWVVKVSDADVVAFSPICTHLGCAYHWDERKNNFLCPCHSSTFGLDGRVLSGPARRPLERFRVRIENGRLLLGAAERSTEPA